jgi:acetyl-CoA acyltransferase
MADVYIAGVDMTSFGRFPNRTVAQIGAEAALLALDDARLDIFAVQAMYCGNVLHANHMVGQRVLREIGQTGIPVTNVSNACASGANAFREAWMAIRGGLYEIVLALGVEKMGKGLLGGVPSDNGFVSEGETGSNTMPAMFSLVGMEHSRQYGTTFEQFAKVAVKNHFNATLNPKAMYRKETPLVEVMGAEMISYPNTKLMCSVNVDGAAAAVLVSEGAARKLGILNQAVRIRASVLTSNPFEARESAAPDFNGVTRLAAKQAYDAAGLGPDDLDLVELHDCFATAELVHYENLGLCALGEAGRLIDQGVTDRTGRLPVNVSGGLLSKGHPLGATGIANIYEVATHLRGRADQRQIRQARLGMTHVCGGGPEMGSACAIHILESPNGIT